MAAAQRPWAADLLHFWFHRLRPQHWFERNDAVDEALRKRFGRWIIALGTQGSGTFLTDARTSLAAIILLDQLPRNLNRADAAAYAYDPLARAICKGVLARGWDRIYSRSERQFCYMPLMHSETINDQLLSLRLFAELGEPVSFRFARDHYRAIARFGRFPHRNLVLGRESTPAEKRAIAAGLAW